MVKSKLAPEGRPHGGRFGGYGWKPQLPDQRDIPLAVRADIMASLPTRVDLRAKCPPVYDQGQLGSCTANALGAAFEFDQMAQRVTAWTPSRLFIYYNERVIEGSVASDDGAEIRDGAKTIA